MKEITLPMSLIALFIYQSIGIKDNVVLIMDRTNWQFGKKNINILMLAIRQNNIAYPLMFTLLDKKGNSNTQERKDLIDQYISIFGNNIQYLLADREFIGEDWLKYLNQQRINYVIRVRNNFQVGHNNQKKYVSKLLRSLKINQTYHNKRRQRIL